MAKAAVAIASGQGVRRLKEAGGKPPARRTETPYRARDSWMSLLRKAKPVLPKAVQSKWGGRMGGKDNGLTGKGKPTRG
jgi:hypothetical protein